MMISVHFLEQRMIYVNNNNIDTSLFHVNISCSIHEHSTSNSLVRVIYTLWLENETYFILVHHGYDNNIMIIR